jgi:hypothetical protein
MRRIEMRTTYIAFGTLVALAATLAACSGGGSGTTPAALSNAGTNSGASASATVPPTFGQNNFTGPTGTVSVTIKIPQTAGHASAAAIARIHAKYGPKHADAHIRSMANTGASAVVRAMGARINANGQATESSRRGAQYVSPSTYYMEFVVTDSTNSTYLVDHTVDCSGGQCTGNFAVPVGTNYNVSLFLYDSYCAYLLSAGTTGGVNVTASATPVPVAITLNPVVDYFDVETSASTFINDASKAQTFMLTVTPLDADNNIETTPGVLLNSSFQQITAVLLQVPVGFGALTSGADQTLTVPTLSNASPAPYGMTSSSYTFKGTTSDSEIIWSAYPVASAPPIVETVATGPNGNGYNTSASYGELDEYPLPVQLIFTNPNGYPMPGQGNNGSQPYQVLFNPQSTSGNPTYFALEFPSLFTNNGSGALGLLEQAIPTPYPSGSGSPSPIPVPYTGNIVLSDNGACSELIAYPTPAPSTSPFPYSALANPPYIVATSFNQASPSPGTCVMEASDTSAQGRQAYLQIYYDSSNLTIQSHARTTK